MRKDGGEIMKKLTEIVEEQKESISLDKKYKILAVIIIVAAIYIAICAAKLDFKIFTFLNAALLQIENLFYHVVVVLAKILRGFWGSVNYSV